MVREAKRRCLPTTRRGCCAAGGQPVKASSPRPSLSRPTVPPHRASATTTAETMGTTRWMRSECALDTVQLPWLPVSPTSAPPYCCTRQGCCAGCHLRQGCSRMAADDVAQTETYYSCFSAGCENTMGSATRYSLRSSASAGTCSATAPSRALVRIRNDSPVSSCKLQVEADIFYFFRFLIVLLKRMFNITRSFSSSLTHLWRAHAGNNKYEHVCIITFLQEEGLSSAVFTLPEKFIS